MTQHPAVAAFLLLLAAVLAAIGVGVGVEAAAGPATPTLPDGLLPPSPSLSDSLVLDETAVTAGTLLEGWLVVRDPGPPLNLTGRCRHA